jgi:hypothetical protein
MAEFYRSVSWPNPLTTGGGRGQQTEEATQASVTDNSMSPPSTLTSSIIEAPSSMASPVSKKPTSAEFLSLVGFLREAAKITTGVGSEQVKALVQAGLRTYVSPSIESIHMGQFEIDADLGYSPQMIAEAKVSILTPIYGDEKTAKKVIAAAKRYSKKRSAPESSISPSSKRSRTTDGSDPAEVEASLALPTPITDEERLRDTILITNRAPVVLAFGVATLKYTMPEQPLSSQLSLAQAVVSMNSRSKAVSLGIEHGKSAEDEGWGMGQAKVKVLGRSVSTMKRVGWEAAGQDVGSQTETGSVADEPAEQRTAFWALDLEALKKSQGSHDGTGVGLASGLPIYTPHSARAYLLKAFDRKIDDDEQVTSGKKKKKKQTAASNLARKEENAALLLGALDLLMQSWKDTLSPAELDSRAWSWYVRVRPDVSSGASGWGAKGELRLADILDFRRQE